MKRIDDVIPDTISGEMRKAFKRSNVADPAEIVFAVGEDSWSRDGRENLPLSLPLIKSLLRAFTTDNSYRDSRGERCKGEKVLDDDKKKPLLKKGSIGDPIVWGTLDSVIVSVMGTDKDPLLVVGASGRQKINNSEYLTAMLAFARSIFEDVWATYPATEGGADAKKRAAEREEEIRKEAIRRLATKEGRDWETAWIEAQPAEFAKACQEAETRIISKLSEEDWNIVFSPNYAKPPLGRPLVGKGYSAVYFVKVDHDETKPTSRAALEKAKLAHCRIPSPILAEADSARRMIEDDVVNRGKIEATAIENTRVFVTNPIAVGPGQDGASYEWTRDLYYVAQCCDSVRARIAAERDPVKALALVKKVAKRCFKPLRDEDTGLTRNALSAEEQEAVFGPRHRVTNNRTPAPTTTPAAPVVNTAEAQRFASLARSPMSSLTAEQRLIAKAVAAGVQYAAGQVAALDEFPFLKVTPTDDEALKEAIDCVDGWNGKGLRPKLRDAADEADARTLEVADKLIDEGLKLCQDKKDKNIWLAEWLRDKRS